MWNRCILIASLVLFFNPCSTTSGSQILWLNDEVDAFVALQHHKTGTVLGGCFFTSLARVIVNGYMYHQRFVDRKALDADYLLQHINNSYTTPPRVFTVRDKLHRLYHQTVSQYAALTGPPVVASGGPILTQCPSVLLHNDDGSVAGSVPQCAGSPFCPCVQNTTRCNALELCTPSLPSGIRLHFIHFIRNPLDTVLSAYAFHMQDPPPEAWLTEVNMKTYAKWMISSGVDASALDALDVFAPCGGSAAHANCSYWHHLRSLPAAHGVLLEFYRSSIDIYGMARQHLWLQHHSHHNSACYRLLTLRMEAFKGNGFDTTIQELLTFVNLRMSKHTLAKLRALVSRRCDVGSMPVRVVQRNNHITQGKLDKVQRLKLREELMGHGEVRRQICQVAEVLGYTLGQCGGGNGGGGDAGGGGNGGGGDAGGVSGGDGF